MSSHTGEHQLRLQYTHDAEGTQKCSIQHSENMDPEEFCETCASIPWGTLVDPLNNQPNNLSLFHQTIEALRSSECPVCRFIRRVVASRKISSFYCLPRYQLVLRDEMAVDDQNIGVLHIIQDGKDVWPASSENSFRVLLIKDPPSIVNPILRSLMIGGLPLVYLKHSIAVCQRRHSDYCSPKNPNILRNLKVLDCETREIICAPADCPYIALSYVWGSKTTGSNVAAALVPENLPQTIADSCFIVRSLGYRYLWVDRYVSMRNW
jgi:hypothetical protein